ncbi:MBL fold metallo-hydrolase RNA specificity domain-containing protein [Stella sp.]|uniref:MBL fold metallo-hydrolase RNA specificity domain-containing protein n=1 Tax=Stella sp. TaxID=2912054 RepID=UPI0035B1AE66
MADAAGPVAIEFLGAAGTVTGSCYRVRHPGGAFLVDCGLFQGSKSLRELNYAPLPFDPAAIDFLALTHAHIDHSGLVPKLIRAGFGGPVLAAEGTRDLLAFLLPDAGGIQEQEVELLNRRRRQRGEDDVTPIYTAADGQRAVRQVRPVPYDTWIDAAGGVRLRWWNAGHILGSASIEVEVPTGDGAAPVLRMLFSGDIGPEHKLFHPDPTAPAALDVLVVEGTYGDRERAKLDPERRRRALADEIGRAFAAGGTVLIPAFAVERTQELLLDLAHLYDASLLPPVPVFIDSPLASAVTGAFRRRSGSLEDMPVGGDPFSRPEFRFVETVEQSKAINRLSGRAIILAGSGMCEAGRIRHHLKARLWRPDTTVLFVGYQATGTLGRVLLDGADRVRIHGEEVRVKARLVRFEHYSGHADRAELLAWIGARAPVALATYLVHGETAALAALAQGLAASGWPADRLFRPELGAVATLPGTPTPTAGTGPRQPPAEGASDEDWHNAYARLLVGLRPALDRLESDRARRDKLAKLRRILDEYR